MSLADILVIAIEYEIYDKHSGIFFQKFYDEKIDKEYDICFTPNFYFNTPCWVPCIYDFKNIIQWEFYIIVSEDYLVYISTMPTCVYYDDINGKKAYCYE